MTTKKPCPGCGQTDPYRRSDQVCSSCAGKLAQFDGLKVALAKATGEGDKVMVTFSKTPWWNQYIPVPELQSFDEDSLSSRLRQAFCNLALAGAIPPADYAHRDQAWRILGSPSAWEYWFMDARLANAIQELHELMKPVVEGAFQAGQADGEQFIRGLADGRVSIAAYDDRMAKRPSRPAPSVEVAT